MTTQSKIDKKFDERFWSPTVSGMATASDIKKFYKKEILSLIEEIGGRLIGDDDWTEEDFDIEEEDDIILDKHRIEKNIHRNNLRAEQRAILDKIVKEL